ncbi:MAG TPA: GntR family transcriptional regulator [Desulfobacteraceae bacterium]|nr:GntR family transcriptional regulator [Desulfobacteraceae bacterium]
MPLPAKENPIDRPSMRDTVYNTLLDWIVDGTLHPGEKVVDKTLAAHMGVSRTPVREALRRLEDKGLIESSANRWTRVAKIAPEEPEMIYPIIQSLEKLALDAAMPRLTPQDISDMTAANAALEKTLKANDPLAASLADTAFHHTLIERSGNLHLIGILEDLKLRFRRLEVIYFKGVIQDLSSVDEHACLLTAIRKNDRQTAMDTLHTNWQKSLDRLKQHRPIPFEDGK